MSDITFHCVVCGGRLHTAAAVGSDLVECPHCLRAVPVPAFGAALEYLGCALPAFPSEILSVDLRFLCERCETKLEIDVRFQDREVTCPNCSTSIRVPRLRTAVPPAGANASQPATASLLTLAETNFLTGHSGSPQKMGTAR